MMGWRYVRVIVKLNLKTKSGMQVTTLSLSNTKHSFVLQNVSQKKRNKNYGLVYKTLWRESYRLSTLRNNRSKNCNQLQRNGNFKWTPVTQPSCKRATQISIDLAEMQIRCAGNKLTSAHKEHERFKKDYLADEGAPMIGFWDFQNFYLLCVFDCRAQTDNKSGKPKTNNFW